MKGTLYEVQQCEGVPGRNMCSCIGLKLFDHRDFLWFAFGRGSGGTAAFSGLGFWA